jgi:hypothetical protein
MGLAIDEKDRIQTRGSCPIRPMPTQQFYCTTRHSFCGSQLIDIRIITVRYP